ncbi:hypothetical protein HMPREF3216_00085 [Gardnerella vaginalis]|uniref:Uncharacterized protein n=1 Tax=Gardnerella vaginalis TaxID=2702 RepID=A0A133NSZ7_GARVA|nr:hypothetical protein HMPREF3216_00085 [Gardnerella vaginalis]
MRIAFPLILIIIRHFLLLEYVTERAAAPEPILLYYYMQQQCQTLSFFCMSQQNILKIKCEKNPNFWRFYGKTCYYCSYCKRLCNKRKLSRCKSHMLHRLYTNFADVLAILMKILTQYFAVRIKEFTCRLIFKTLPTKRTYQYLLFHARLHAQTWFLQQPATKC